MKLKLSKLLKVMVVSVILLLSSGCVKFNATMEINKDKSMNFSIIYAVEESLLDGEELFSDEDIKELEDSGCTVSDYSESTKKGIKIVYKEDNIDDVSSESDDVEYNLSSITSMKDSNNKLFKVKKGFFKNTYVAKFDFDTSDAMDDSSFDDEDDYSSRDDFGFDDDDFEFDEDDFEFDDEDDYYEYYGDDYDFDYDYTTDDGDDDFLTDDDFSDMAEYMSGMDLKFEVKLPYKAISSNATSKNNDGKDLTWNLMEFEDEGALEFEFELYNTTNIIIVIVIGIVVIVALVLFLLKGKKKNTGVGSPINTNNQLNFGQNMPINTFPVNNNSVSVMPSANDNTVNSVDTSSQATLSNIPSPTVDNTVNSVDTSSQATLSNIPSPTVDNTVNSVDTSSQATLSNIPSPTVTNSTSDDLI